MGEIFWHNLPLEKVAKKLISNLNNGLSEREVKIRQEKFGKNEIEKEKPLSKLAIFFSQFKSPLVFILIIAGLVTLILQNYLDSIVIFGAVILNSLVGFLQENKATKALRELKKVIKYKARVIREGNQKIVDSSELVLGDIFVLKAGDRVPADGRLIEAENLKINEMILTGEWWPARKSTEVLPRETPLADRNNMVYMGTIVEEGSGKAIVTATGSETEMGKVAKMIRETKEEKTPLQKKLSHFAKIVGGIILAICFFIFVSGIFSGKNFEQMFTVSVAMAVSAIPEGLPVAMTVILAIGMQRILKRKGLVRKLLAAETLGSTSLIATDKTCTLTEGKMKVDKILGDKFLALKAAILTSDVFVENPKDPREKWKIRGNPTERAIFKVAIETFSLDKKRKLEKQKIANLPFNPKNKFAAAIFKEEGKNMLYVCGAPEKILKFCNLKDKERENLEKNLEKLTQEGSRVVASAFKEIKDQKLKNIEDEINNLSFAGFIALKDPIRPKVKEAIKICQKAGMKPIIVTGDHKLTAMAVAKELGLEVKRENILEGKDLDKLSDEELEKILPKIKIFARVEPRHKLRIISAFKEKGEIVAMTGDGVNDAPALKRADIGVALGSGSDVAKEVADLILLTDSFDIIVAAIEEGRAIIDNIRKVITYLFSSCFAEIVLIFASLLFNLPLPILPAQILWANLIEDGPISLALAFEPKEKDLMERKPEKKKPLLTKEMKAIIFIIGTILNFLLLLLYFCLLKFTNYDIFHVRTIIFVGLVIDSLFFIFSCKSLRHNIWQINLFSNRFLVISWLFSVLMLLVAIYLPPFQILLRTIPLNFFDWLLLFGLGILSFLLIEVTKWYFIAKSSQKT